MGTSKGYGGARTGLIPSWIDDPAPGTMPGTPPAVAPPAAPPPAVPQPTAPPAGPPNPGTPAQPAPAVPRPPPQPDTSGSGALGGARGSFSRFAGSGSRSALGHALSNYVRNGTGGARRAARRMGVSRVAGARLLGVVRDVQRLGPTEALRRLDLAGLAGRPAPDVFLSMLEFLCPPGGAVEEAITRQAMLDAIGDLAEAGAGSFDAMTADQLREFFLDFIARSIEGRVMADLGGRGITLPDDVAAVENAQQQLHDFVAGCTRGELAGRLDGVEQLADRDVERVVNEIYEAAFGLVAAAGEAAA